MKDKETKIERETEREKERESEIDRQIDRERERERERERDSETEKQKQRKKERERERKIMRNRGIMNMRHLHILKSVSLIIFTVYYQRENQCVSFNIKHFLQIYIELFFLLV